MPAVRSLGAALVLAVAIAGRAWAYEFEVAAESIAQGYQVRWIRFSEQDRLLNRRRFTQSLSLDVWNILEPSFDPVMSPIRPHPPPLAPFDVFVTLQLRIDHDFGDYTQGGVVYPIAPSNTIEEAAVSAVPELAGADLGLVVLAASAGARDIFGRLDVALGRQLLVDGLDWMALDGLRLVARLPAHLAVEGHAGFLVRDASPVASPTFEPDGSASAQCTEFSVEDGVYLPAGECRGRLEPAPTFGAALATHGLRWLGARVSYRRSVSPTAGGLYPDAADQAPSWGVLEELAAATVRGTFLDGSLVPWAAARWNLLLGLVDEAHVGVRLAAGAHALAPEVLYSFPSFDGDSIFNVFSSEPYLDLRLTYDVRLGALRGYGRGFWRRFWNSDTETVLPGQSVADHADAGGGMAGARLLLGDRGLARLDLSYEDGHGGLRAGADLSARLRLARRLGVDGRVSLIHFAHDLLPGRDATSFGAQAGARLVLGPGMALHLSGEYNRNRFEDQLRVVGVLDLAFRPEH
jgi:hypothetical protein